jgi:ionotropic glutamate receptor
MPPQCNGKPPNVKKDKVMPISLKDLTGAFFVLLVGMSLSIWHFSARKSFLFLSVD